MKGFVICFLAIIFPDLCAARRFYRGSRNSSLDSGGAGLVAGCIIAGFIIALLIIFCIVKKCKRKPKVAASSSFVQQPTWNQQPAPYNNKFSPYGQPQFYEQPPPPYSAAPATPARPYV